MAYVCGGVDMQNHHVNVTVTMASMLEENNDRKSEATGRCSCELQKMHSTGDLIIVVKSCGPELCRLPSSLAFFPGSVDRLPLRTTPA